MITFLCWYFGLSITYTIVLYLTLTSDKVFCWLLENGKDTQFNNYLNQLRPMLYPNHNDCFKCISISHQPCLIDTVSDITIY